MLRDPRDAGYGGKLDPDPPRPGDRFRTPAGILTVDRLELAIESADAPTHFIVRAGDGARWALVSCDPILDRISYTGTPVTPHPAPL